MNASGWWGRCYRHHCWILLAYCLAVACFSAAPAAAFTHCLTVHRSTVATVATIKSGSSVVEVALARTVQGWRHDNLGLWFLPPPRILETGEDTTGVGLVLERIPPAGLREGIVACRRYDSAGADVTEEESSSSSAISTIELEYKILNPSWITWPVAEHKGCIRLTEVTLRENVTRTTRTAVLTTIKNAPNPAVGCDLEWNVWWTPLAVPLFAQPLWNVVLEHVTSAIIHTAADYIAKENESKIDGDSSSEL